MMESSGGVILANPNAPTGKAIPLSAIRRVLDGNPDTVVIVDEAYIDYGGESVIGLIMNTRTCWWSTHFRNPGPLPE
jgi:histidinol-phosphate/aromatic aminotransferase/cobyric acid decarboxylase-like protein